MAYLPKRIPIVVLIDGSLGAWMPWVGPRVRHCGTFSERGAVGLEGVGWLIVSVFSSSGSFSSVCARVGCRLEDGCRL